VHIHKAANHHDSIVQGFFSWNASFTFANPSELMLKLAAWLFTQLLEFNPSEWLMGRDKLLGSLRTGSYLDHFDPSYSAVFLGRDLVILIFSPGICRTRYMPWRAYGKLLMEAQELRGAGENASTY
jgi:hypothetical protein